MGPLGPVPGGPKPVLGPFGPVPGVLRLMFHTNNLGYIEPEFVSYGHLASPYMAVK